MVKKLLIVLMAFALVAGLTGYSIAQGDEGKVLSGTIEEVADDGSYVILDGQKMIIDPELKEYMNMEAGDEVELLIEKTEQGELVVDFDYK